MEPVCIRREEDGVDCYGIQSAQEQVLLGACSVWDRARVGFLFFLWYLLSTIYSIKNKQAHLALAMPLTIATAQLLVGGLLAVFLWGSRLRTPPRFSGPALQTLLPIGFMHGIGHLTGVYATAVGSVSFVQVVKSAGPFWASVLSTLLLRERVSRRVWLSLLPIVGGVGLASAKEASFVFAAFVGAAASDVALALRNVLTKLSLNKPKADNMTAANSFYTLTILSCVLCLPIAAGLEWASAATSWAAAAPSRDTTVSLLTLIAQGGLYFTAYSEVQFLALSQISPITHAVGNTMRRVVIMLVCIAVFGTPVSLLGGIGSAIAIAGTYAYAMAKTHEKEETVRKEAAAAPEKNGTDTDASSVSVSAPRAGRIDHPLLPAMKAIGRFL
jgi:solute carrier family 35 protein E1